MEVYGPRAKKCRAVVFCNSCRRDTNHTLQYAVSNADYADELEDDEKIHRTIGLRTIIEGICADKGIEGNNLYEKIRGI